MYPARNPYGFPGQNRMPNFGNGFRFQHNSPLPPMGMRAPMWNPMPRANAPSMIRQQFQRHNQQYNDNNRGKRRHTPYQQSPYKQSPYKQPPYKQPPYKPSTSKKARYEQETVQIRNDEGKIFKVPVSEGTEKITVGIWNYFLKAQMSELDLRKKLKLRKALHTVLEQGFQECRLFIVGSTMTGFATSTSDVDMCLMISETEVDQKADAAFILARLARVFRNCAFVRSPQVIRAKVPILKFTDPNARIECDLNINNTIGIRNTHLLRHYAFLDWRVRPLMLFIKRWARFHDINDASKKTISSYSLSLMLIHYLQSAVRPRVLPCLQQIEPDLFSSEKDVRDVSLSMEDLPTFESENGASLGELFLGFLNYYANLHNYDHIISVRLGISCDIEEGYEHGIDASQWKCLRIEEPFERTNTARSVFDQHVFWRILRVITASFNKLDQTRDLESILSRPF